MGRAGVLLVFVLAAACAEAPAPESASALSLKPCTLGGNQRPMECGRLVVPEDRRVNASTGANRREIALNMIVVRRTSGTATEALFLLAGGPGQASTTMINSAISWLRPVLDTMDIVLIDQRGTGDSNVLQCESDIVANPARAFGHVLDPDVVRACRTALEARADLTQYTTDAAVADLESARRALGYERIALYGGSYGTRLAQAYVRRHASTVKAAVLDGVVPFDGPPQLEYARSVQGAVERVFESCRTTPACHSAYPNLEAGFQKILDRLERGPAATTVRSPTGEAVPVTLTKNDFAYAVRGILYSEDGVADLPGMVTHAATSGDLSEFARRYWVRAVNLGRTIARGQHLSVFCAEDIGFATEAEIQTASAKTFMGRYLIDDYRHACALWPRTEIASDFRTPISVRVPVLLLSGRFDPVTPPEFGERVGRALPVSRHIVAPGGAHGVAMDCPRPAVLHVLMRGTLEGMPDVCR